MLGAAADAIPGCPECEVAAGRRVPEGGLVRLPPGLLVHEVLGASPLAGWMVVAPARHVEQVADLSVEEMAAIAETARLLAGSQRDLLGATKSYVALFAEVVPHLHFHVVPRFPGTPESLRGPRAFQAPAVEMRPPAELAAAAQRLLGAFGAPLPRERD